MYTDLDVAFETLKKFNVNLERSLVILGINLNRVSMHRQNFNLAAKFWNQKLDILASRHERIQLNLRISNIILKNSQLLAHVEALFYRLR